MAHWSWPQFVMTHEMCSTCSTYPQIRKDGIIQTSPVAAMDRLKDPPTWLKVATIQEIDLQPWAPRQWTSTTTRWRCGLILLPSLTLRSPHPRGNKATEIEPFDHNSTNVLLILLCCTQGPLLLTETWLWVTVTKTLMLSYDKRCSE